MYRIRRYGLCLMCTCHLTFLCSLELFNDWMLCLTKGCQPMGLKGFLTKLSDLEAIVSPWARQINR